MFRSQILFTGLFALLTSFLFIDVESSLAQEVAQGKVISAARLLPSNTILYVNCPDFSELKERFSQTNLGLMLQDEELQPVLGEVYGAIDEEYEEYAREHLGIGLADLPNVIEGEFSFALVSPSRADMAVVLFAEIGEDNQVAQTLLEKGRERARNDEFEESSEDIGETKLMILSGRERLFYFQREGRFVFSNNEDVIRSLIDRWDGNVDKRDRSLATNRKFMNVMERCNGTKEERPQISVFADPIEIFRSATRGNPMATIGLGIVRTLGLDGLSAVGASMYFSTEEFDSLMEAHVLLANPRSGVIEMLALESGDVTPEPFVPYNVSNYMTMNWNVQKTLLELEKLIDSFQGEGTYAEQLANANEATGIDIQKDIIELLTGRMTMATMYTEPEAINGQANLFAIGVKDMDKVQETIDALLDKAIESGADEENLGEEKTFQGVDYRFFKGPDMDEVRKRQLERRRERAERNGEPAPREYTNLKLRSPQPCFALHEGFLIITDSEDLMKEAIRASKDKDESLAVDPDYARIMKEIKKHLEGRDPGFVQYSRPEEVFRMLYDFAQSETTRTVMGERGEEVRILRNLKTALDENELPEFESLTKYLAPSGGVITNEETGFHYMAFSLRGDEEQ